MNTMPVTVLIVDDEPMVSRMLRAFLELKGLSVDTAATGNEALEKLRRGGFDAAVIDMRLPDMTGDEVIVRGSDVSGGTHFFIHTGSLDYRLSSRLREIGICDEDILQKPMKDMGDLHIAIMKRLGRSLTGSAEG